MTEQIQIEYTVDDDDMVSVSGSVDKVPLSVVVWQGLRTLVLSGALHNEHYSLFVKDYIKDIINDFADNSNEDDAEDFLDIVIPPDAKKH